MAHGPERRMRAFEFGKVDETVSIGTQLERRRNKRRLVAGYEVEGCTLVWNVNERMRTNCQRRSTRRRAQKASHDGRTARTSIHHHQVTA